MERTLQTTIVRRTWSASQSGWTLSFTHETGVNESIFCNGSKEGGGTVNANLNPASNASGVNFHGTAHDSTIAAAIISELEDILTEE